MAEDATDIADHGCLMSICDDDGVFEIRDRFAGPFHWGMEIDFHDLSHPLGFGINEPPDAPDAGVVDEQIETPIAVLIYLTPCRVPGRFVGDVADDWDDHFARAFPSVCTGDEFIESAAASGDGDDAATVLDELAGKFATNPAARTGDDRERTVGSPSAAVEKRQRRNRRPFHET